MGRVHLLGGALMLILVGCGINSTGLSRDMRVILDYCNVKPKTLKATMSDRSRAGIVEFSVTADEVAAIVSGLGLQEAGSNTDEPDLSSWLDDGTSQYDHPLLGSQEGIEVFRSTRRPEILRLPNGSSFEYMLLFWDKAKGTALVQLSYAYG